MSDTLDAVIVEPATIADLRIGGPARGEGEATLLPVRVAIAGRLLHLHRVMPAEPVIGPRMLAPVYAAVDADGRAAGDVRMAVVSTR